MAGFNTHIGASTFVGIGYGLAGHFAFQMPLPVAAIAGGLCSVAGILPDVDSESGKPVREIAGFAAAVVPLLLVPRLEALGLSAESVMLAGGCIYLLVRFGVFATLRRYAVHRGMWHSIPAAFVAGLFTALLLCDVQLEYRLFKSAAVVVGYLTHLLVDELYSYELRGLPRAKRSAGTALKFWGSNKGASLSVYASLAICLVLLIGDPSIRSHLPPRADAMYRVAREALDRAFSDGATGQGEIR